MIVPLCVMSHARTAVIPVVMGMATIWLDTMTVMAIATSVNTMNMAKVTEVNPL